MNTGIPPRRSIGEVIPSLRVAALEHPGQWLRWEPMGQDFRYAWRVRPDGKEELAVRRFSGQPIEQSVVTRLLAQFPEDLEVLSRRVKDGHLLFTLARGDRTDGDSNEALAGEAVRVGSAGVGNGGVGEEDGKGRDKREAGDQGQDG